MPLHGKIVVIKRSGDDGTEFPLISSCLFGRKADCDIRIQLPQVSKEHCRIDINENKEVVLTNLSSVNPTLINGKELQQSERLKDGDLITIIDRSFRFQYPPAPTPRKTPGTSRKAEKPKVLQDQHAGDVITETGPRKVLAGTPLKDGTNIDNIQRPLGRNVGVDSAEDGGPQSKTSSPFGDLYQMIKQSLDAKTPCKPASSLLQTPTSRFYTPQSDVGSLLVCSAIKSAANRADGEAPEETDRHADGSAAAPVKKQGESQEGAAASMPALRSEERLAKQADADSAKKRVRASPQRLTLNDVIQIISTEKTARRSSREVAATPVRSSPGRRSPKASPPETDTEGKDGAKESDGEAVNRSPKDRKRVSFGGKLMPELFDKRLPPNSPLRRGATPQRDVALSKPRHSLLRQVSAMGHVKEGDEASTTPKDKKKQSPKNGRAKTPSPGPKVSPPEAQAHEPWLSVAAIPALVPKDKADTPKGPRASDATRGRSSSSDAAQEDTPRVQGRFSVSRISTPSPTGPEEAEEELEVDAVPLAAVTPKVPLKRMSMKAKRTSTLGSAVKLLRRSGVSRASLRAKQSWADVVKFAPTKSHVAPVSKMAATAKTVTKKAAPVMEPPKTPAGKRLGHVSTGHADSPVTIVVGKAHRLKVNYTNGAAPRLVTNAKVDRRELKMDEDLTGVADIFKTPANTRKRKSVMQVQEVTSVGASATASVEASLLQTPEEPGEMFVSPLSVSSSAKRRRKFSGEAVRRLLRGDSESSTSETSTSSSEEPELGDAKTPQQRAEPAGGLTGVKRLLRTPRQRAEPLEDLRGRILRTPKQKPEQVESLSGVKRLMKTPKQKAEPVEDLRGRLLVTPKQKPEEVECLSAVKRVMKTPKQRAEPVEDLRGRLLVTPKHKPEQVECLSAIKRVFATPAEEQPGGPRPEGPEAAELSLYGQEELLQTPAQMRESSGFPTASPEEKTSPPLCLTGVKRMMRTPRQKNAPVEDMVGVRRLLTTPREKVQPVEDNLGLQRLMRSPRVKGNPPVDDFEGLQELMEEPQDFTAEEQPQSCEVKEVDMAEEEADVPPASSGEDGPSGIVASQDLREQRPSEDVETDDSAQKDHKVATKIRATKKTPIQRRGVKTAAALADQHGAAESGEDLTAATPARGRRTKKTEAAAPPAGKQTTRSRRAKCEEPEFTEVASQDLQPCDTPGVVRPTRGRRAKQAAGKLAMATPEMQEVAEPEKDDVCEEKQQEVPPNVEGDEAVAVETAPQEAEGPVDVQTKVSRGRREVPAAAPARGRRGKMADATPAPARQTTRGRKAVEVQQEEHQAAAPTVKRGRSTRQAQEETAEAPELPAEPQTDVCAPVAAPQEEEEPSSSSPAKPRRGRATKVAEQSADTSSETSSTVTKARRGRQAQQVPEEVKGQSQAEPQQVLPPARTTRGRKKEDITVAAGAKSRRTRKGEKEVEVHTAESAAAPQSSEEEASGSTEEIVAEPGSSLIAEATNEEPQSVAEKPRRGRRKAATDGAAPAEVQEEPAEKPKRGRTRGRQNVAEDATEAPEEHLNAAQEAEESSAAEEPTRKRGGGKRAKVSTTSAEQEEVPAKRVCRAAHSLPQENIAESVEAPAVPAAPRRGRRAAAKPSKEEEEASEAAAAEKKTVTWKEEVVEPTPLKVSKGRKTKACDPDTPQGTPAKRGRRANSSTSSPGVRDGRTEEKLLSAQPVAEPVRRTRRGTAEPELPRPASERRRAKAAPVAAEAPLPTRRRAAKK